MTTGFTNVYVFSAKNDSVYVDHLRTVSKSLNNINLLYFIGQEGNCDSDHICATDPRCQTSVLIQSYTAVPNFQKVTDSFFWVSPKYSHTCFDHKIIAVENSLDQNGTNDILRCLVLPQNLANLDYLKRIVKVKDHAECSKRVALFLK